MTEKQIFFGCPMHNRAWIIPYYLRNLYNQTYPKHLISILWLVNNCKDNTFHILSEFKKQYENEYKSITIRIYNDSKIPDDERSTEVREKYLYYRLSDLRNRMLEEFLKTDCDYFVSCDSDILMRKDCIERLVSHNKDFVAGLIYNGYLSGSTIREKGLFYGDPIENAYLYPNILNEVQPNKYTHVVNNRVRYPERAKDNPLIKVSFTGAVNILSRAVCEKSRYSWAKQGEDAPFCHDALKHGFEIYCDLYNYNQHVMSPTLLEQFKNFGIE